MPADYVVLRDLYTDQLLRVSVVGGDIFLAIGEDVEDDDSVDFYPTATVAVASLDLANAALAGFDGKQVMA